MGVLSQRSMNEPSGAGTMQGMIIVFPSGVFIIRGRPFNFWMLPLCERVEKVDRMNIGEIRKERRQRERERRKKK